MRIVAVILAGGEGSRIGGGKPQRRLGGRPLLEQAVNQAGQWSQDVAVAVRDERQAGGAKVRVIFDEPEIDGPLGGLAAALRFARKSDAEAVLSLAADMPFLPHNLGERLQREIGGNLAAVAASGGRLHPVCGLWRAAALVRLPSYLATGKRSLKGFAESIGFIEVEWPAEPDDPFFNINTREDLQAAQSRLGP
ncbi:MAG: molybdenum cofactor guanylyltransferase [Alphaproteobacteria bacterium]